MEKKKVTRRKEIDYYDLLGTFDDVIEVLQHKKKAYPKDAKLDLYCEEEYGSYNVRLDVYWSDEETDEECRNREAMEAHARQYRLRQYESLKKEFG